MTEILGSKRPECDELPFQSDARGGGTGAGAAQYGTASKAKALKVDLTTAYNACGVPNDTEGTSPPLPACHPPVLTSSTHPAHVVTFGPKGAANIQVGATKDDIKIGVKSADILDNGVTIADGQQLGLHIDHAISTSDSCASMDPAGCTSVDLGIVFNQHLQDDLPEGEMHGQDDGEYAHPGPDHRRKSRQHHPGGPRDER